MCCFYRKKARREFCIMTTVATDIFGIPKTEPRLYQYLQKMPKDAHVIVVKNSDKLDERKDHAFIRDFMEMCEIDDLGIIPSIVKNGIIQWVAFRPKTLTNGQIANIAFMLSETESYKVSYF